MNGRGRGEGGASPHAASVKEAHPRRRLCVCGRLGGGAGRACLGRARVGVVAISKRISPIALTVALRVQCTITTSSQT